MVPNLLKNSSHYNTGSFITSNGPLAIFNDPRSESYCTGICFFIELTGYSTATEARLLVERPPFVECFFSTDGKADSSPSQPLVLLPLAVLDVCRSLQTSPALFLGQYPVLSSTPTCPLADDEVDSAGAEDVRFSEPAKRKLEHVQSPRLTLRKCDEIASQQQLVIPHQVFTATSHKMPLLLVALILGRVDAEPLLFVRKKMLTRSQIDGAVESIAMKKIRGVSCAPTSGGRVDCK